MNMRIKMLLIFCCIAASTLVLLSAVTAADDAPVASAAAATPAVQNVPNSALASASDENYRIAEEDVLRLDVWGEPTLSNVQMQVTPDGKINVAYIGEIKAAGMSQDELKEKIVARLEEEQILIKAKVSITLITMHQPTVRVLGQVSRPGAYQFKDGDTIMDAIAQAGSYTETAWLEQTTVTHKGSDKPVPINLKKIFMENDLSQNYELQKGDTIHIPSENYENKIYVMGQVIRPGLYDLKDKCTVLAALNLAGGPTERASVRGTTIVRGDASKTERVSCNLSKLLDKADLSQDVALQPGDVVYVPETKQPNWSKISQILSVISNLGAIRRYGIF